MRSCTREIKKKKLYIWHEQFETGPAERTVGLGEADVHDSYCTKKKRDNCKHLRVVHVTYNCALRD